MKKFLESLVEERAPGPYPSFSVYHLLKALELVAKTGHVGRGKLAEELKIGEGATRTLIERLKKANVITISKKGCSLTEKGKKLWKEFVAVFPQKINLKRNELALTECSVAVQVRDGGKRVRAGVEQRDAAVVAGAKGAVTLVLKHGKLTMPNISQDVSDDFPMAFSQITTLLKLNENDAIVIGSADTWSQAEYGALAAAWTLVQNNAT